MKILHTGDLHLDSPFSTSSIINADKRRRQQRQTLGRIFDLAEKEGCDMLLIAGDLFDEKYVTPETEKYILTLFAEASFPIVISPGNHDPYVSGSFYKSGAFSDNVYIFSSNELQCFDFPELAIRVYGYAFTSSKMTSSPLAYRAPADKCEYTSLLCAHGELSVPMSSYCPLQIGDILSLGVSYAALGHIHKASSEGTAASPYIRYCGFAEGRSYDECGDGGVFIVDIKDGMPPAVTRHTVSTEKYEITEIDISACTERSEVIEKISLAAKHISAGKGTHLRVRLTGNAESALIPEEKELLRYTDNNILSVQIKNLTVPVEDTASLSQDISLRGAFYNTLLSGLTHEDIHERERCLLALKIGLAAIDGREIPQESDEI